MRLTPGAEQKISFGGNPVTAVRIDERGFRQSVTADAVPERKAGVVVVGDSQVFGLGVEYEEAFAAKLGDKLGRPVLNAGIPTYGPGEYNAVLKRVLAEGKFEHVVYVVNIANDLFEAARPNRERHSSWDGWAVRIETAPAEVTSFPGRQWLYGRSHAFFALRKWLFEGDVAFNDAAFPSEGGWQDITKEGAAASEQRKLRRREFMVRAQFRDTETRAAERKLMRAQLAVERAMYGEMIGDNWMLSTRLRAARAKPGDIVTSAPGEGGRPLAATAEQIRSAVRYRNKMEKALRKIAAEAQGEKKKKLDDVLTRRDNVAKKAEMLRTAPLALVRASTPLSDAVEQAHKLCKEHGAELWVVTLPLDVQVSADEWKKYAGEPVDMSGSEVLLSDIVGHAQGVGAHGVDVTTALQQAEPGAFLARDLHLSPKGHTAVASAIAGAMQAPHKPLVARALPAGRSRVPHPDHWRLRKETIVKGSDAAGCETKLHREWLRVRCTKRMAGDPTPAGVRTIEGGEDALAIHYDEVSTFIAPIVKGSHVQADFFWDDGSRRRLTAQWKADAAYADTFKLEEVSDEAAPAAPAEAKPLCDCFKKVSKAKSCAPLMAAPDGHCAATYANDCRALLGCSQGDPVYPPDCPKGQISAGGTGHCVSCTPSLCGPEVPVTTVALPPAHDEAKLVELSKAFLKAADNFAKHCEIRAAWDETLLDACYMRGHCPLPHDKGCGFEPHQPKDVAEAFAPLAAFSGPSASKLRGAGANFVRNAELLTEHIARTTVVTDECVNSNSVWVRASCFADTRGTLAIYQGMADAWNLWRPEDTIPTRPITTYRYGIHVWPLKRLKQTSRAVSLAVERYGSYYNWAKGADVVVDNERLHWIRCHDGPCLLAGY